MVAPDDLPSFHIEVKGTASGKLEYSKLKSWVKQIKGDVMHGQIPVIFNKANNKEWVGLIPLSTFRTLAFEQYHLDVCTDESFNPYESIISHNIFNTVSSEILQTTPIDHPYLIGFGLGDSGPIIGMDAQGLLGAMLKYENRTKTN